MSSLPARRGAPPISPAASPARRLAAVGAVLAGATLAACGDDPFDQDAQFDTQGALVIVYPLGTASAELPVAVDLSNLRALRPGLSSAGTPNFDVALDLDASGQVRVLPPQYVLIPATGVQRVGAQALAGQTFDDVALAPERGYRFDTVTVASVGQPVVVQTPGLSCNSSAPLHAKLVVDSIVGARRAMYLRVRIDPNCGFRSLAPGRPEE